MLAKAFLIKFLPYLILFQAFAAAYARAPLWKIVKYDKKKIDKNEEKSCLLEVPKPLVSHTN